MNNTTRLTRDSLVETFMGYGRPRSGWLVGGEFERALVRPDGQPVGYHGPDGIRAVLEYIHDQIGWPGMYEAGNPIGLQGPRATVTLEPGGQVELSGAPHRRLPGLAEEMLEARQHLLDFAADRDLLWIACGYTPYAKLDDIEWMPKGRYVVMREYLPQRGDLAHAMMKGTCSVQANFDYLDETDCSRKVGLAAKLAPLTTAMFANSPLRRGEDTGFKSFRAHIWTRTDPDRTGLPRALREHYGHERWVDYLLDSPMMFYYRGGEYLPAHGRPFRAFLEDGHDGVFPTLDDWALHQTSVFPEVRVKHTIEVRGADCVSSELAMSFCALFTGLMYCRRALDEAMDLADELQQTCDRPTELLARAAHRGLDAEAGGRSYGDWSSDLLDIATRGMARCHAEGLPMLEPLHANVEAGRCPADDILDAFRRDPSPENVLPVIAY